MGLRVALKPAGTLAVNATFPLKPLMLAAVIVVEPELPFWTLTEVGLAARLKSGGHVGETVTDTGTVWVNGDPVGLAWPLTLTVLVPESQRFGSVIVRVEEAMPPCPGVTLVGLNANWRLGSFEFALNATDPPNPLMLCTFIVVDPDEPVLKANVLGLAEIPKLVGLACRVPLREKVA